MTNTSANTRNRSISHFSGTSKNGRLSANTWPKYLRCGEAEVGESFNYDDILLYCNCFWIKVKAEPNEHPIMVAANSSQTRLIYWDLQRALPLRRSVSTQNLCTDSTFPENSYTFLLFSRRSSSESSEICVEASGHTHIFVNAHIFLWTDVSMSAEIRARSWRFESDWCEASH